MALDQVLISEISNRLSKKRTEKVPKAPSMLKMKTFMIQTCVVLRHVAASADQPRYNTSSARNASEVENFHETLLRQYYHWLNQILQCFQPVSCRGTAKAQQIEPERFWPHSPGTQCGWYGLMIDGTYKTQHKPSCSAREFAALLLQPDCKDL